MIAEAWISKVCPSEQLMTALLFFFFVLQKCPVVTIAGTVSSNDECE